MTTELSTAELLEELHRHRQHHIGQINAVNMAASVGMAGLAVTIVVASPGAIGHTSGPAFLAWSAFGCLAIGGATLFVAAGLHWNFHVRAIRSIDSLILQCLGEPSRASDVRNAICVPPYGPIRGLAPDARFTIYTVAAVGLALLAAATLQFIAARLLT